MGDCHTSIEKYSLSEHAQLRRSLHHKVLLEHQCQGRIFLPENFASDPSSASEWALDEYYFLQPVQARQRRAMLHEAGVVRIDPTEREECRSLRISRGRCGCSCREICRPPSCACYRSGIGCQVDQMAFPCSCSRTGCANPHGRIEFNAARVRAHFIRTLLQLGLEQNAAAVEYGSALPPPAKRCCLEEDQAPMPLSSSFSSSSLLINSSCIDSASVSAANGFEPQTVYFDSVESLPGLETMVVAYDEDYDEDNDVSSSETSSDGGTSFDGILADADDSRTAATMHDTRQRTLDDYVVRFSRQHMYADTGPSSGSFAAGLQLGTAAKSPLNAPRSSTVTCHSLTPQCHPTVGYLGVKISHANCLPDDTARFYCMPNDTGHDYALPGAKVYGHSMPEAVSGNYSESLAATATLSYYTTDDVRCNYRVSDNNTAGYFTRQEDATDSCSTHDSAVHGHIVTYNTPSCSTQGATCVYSTLDTKHGYCPLEDTAWNCCTADTNSGYTAPQNTSEGCCVSDVTGSYSTQRNATNDLSVADNDSYCYYVVDETTLSSCTSNTDNTGHGNLVAKINVSDNTADGCDSTQDCSTQETSGSYSTQRRDTVCSYSVLHDNVRGYCTSHDTTCGNSITDNSTHGCPVSQDITHTYFTTDGTQNTVPGFTTTEDDTRGYCTPHNTTCSHSVQQDTSTYLVPCDLTHSYSTQDDIIHGNSKTVDTAHGYSVPDDSTHDSSSLDDTAGGCCMPEPDSTHACLVTDDHTHDDSNTANTIHGYCVPDDSIHSHSSVGDTAFSYSATGTDDIMHSCSMSENAADGGYVPDNPADGCYMPDDSTCDSPMPENNGNGYSIPDYSTNSCSMQQNIRLGNFVHLETDDIAVAAATESSPCDNIAVVTATEPHWTDSIAVAAATESSPCDSIAVATATEPSQPVQNENCISASHCQVSCSQSDILGEEIVTGNKTVSDVSETLNDAASITGSACGDQLLEHSTLRETVTQSCIISQPASVITRSCVLSNHLSSVVKSCETVKSDDITATHDFSRIMTCPAVCSFNGSEMVENTVQTLPSSLAPDSDQLIVPGNLASDFQNTSDTSCCAEDFEYIYDVSNVTSTSKCPDDDKNSDSVLANTACHDERDVE